MDEGEIVLGFAGAIAFCLGEIGVGLHYFPDHFTIDSDKMIRDEIPIQSVTTKGHDVYFLKLREREILSAWTIAYDDPRHTLMHIMDRFDSTIVSRQRNIPNPRPH